MERRWYKKFRFRQGNKPHPHTHTIVAALWRLKKICTAKLQETCFERMHSFWNCNPGMAEFSSSFSLCWLIKNSIYLTQSSLHLCRLGCERDYRFRSASRCLTIWRTRRKDELLFCSAPLTSGQIVLEIPIGSDHFGGAWYFCQLCLRLKIDTCSTGKNANAEAPTARVTFHGVCAICPACVGDQATAMLPFLQLFVLTILNRFG